MTALIVRWAAAALLIALDVLIEVSASLNAPRLAAIAVAAVIALMVYLTAARATAAIFALQNLALAAFAVRALAATPDIGAAAWLRFAAVALAANVLVWLATRGR